MSRAHEVLEGQVAHPFLPVGIDLRFHFDEVDSQHNRDVRRQHCYILAVALQRRDDVVGELYDVRLPGFDCSAFVPIPEVLRLFKFVDVQQTVGEFLVDFDFQRICSLLVADPPQVLQ